MFDEDEHVRSAILAALRESGPCTVADLVACREGITAREVRQSLMYMERHGFVARQTTPAGVVFSWCDRASSRPTRDMHAGRATDPDVDQWTATRRRVSRLVHLEVEALSDAVARGLSERPTRHDLDRWRVRLAVQVLVDQVGGPSGDLARRVEDMVRAHAAEHGGRAAPAGDGSEP